MARSARLCTARIETRNFGIAFAICIFMEVHYFPVSNAFDAVSELLDKQLFSNSKSDIVTNVFTDALVKIVQRDKTYPTR